MTKNQKLRLAKLFFLFCIMAISFFKNVFRVSEQGDFKGFQADSEALVTGIIEARRDGIDTGIVGLGFYNSGYYNIPDGVFSPYHSQFGLQGKIFCFFDKITFHSEYYKRIFHILCAGATALVLLLISFLISKKYNRLLGGIFYVTFFLSPWITNFARNLYWVEFTWFIPMLLGLVCSIWIRNKKIRLWCYLGAFVSIFIKSLCGYEYLTTIMLAMISFLIIDFIMAFIEKDKTKTKLIFRTVFIIGVCAVVGFVFAICLHAFGRGNGNLIAGLKSIYKNDVLRRTLGGNPADFAPVYTDSFNASIFYVLALYVCAFHKNVLLGITPNLFPVLCGLPAFILIWDFISGKKIDLERLVMYFVFLITSISWFVLGKSHSYIHTHMNYVLWYFGFVQICLYIIIEKIIVILKSVLSEEK